MRKAHRKNIRKKTSKQHLKIRKWNVKTLYPQVKCDTLILESEDLILEMLEMSEARWMDAGYFKKDKYTLSYSDGKEYRKCVGFLVNNEIRKFVNGYWAPKTERC